MGDRCRYSWALPRLVLLPPLRSTLKWLAVDVFRLKGPFLVLADKGSVAPAKLPPPPDAPLHAIDAGEAAESGVKIIPLGTALRRARAPSRLQVVKD